MEKEKIPTYKKQVDAPLDVAEIVTCPGIWFDLHLSERNLCTQQSGHTSFTNSDEMKTGMGVSYSMTINPSPYMSMYWNCNGYVGNRRIQNFST